MKQNYRIGCPKFCITYGVTNGKVIALGAEYSEQAGTSRIQRPADQQRDVYNGEKNDSLGNENG